MQAYACICMHMHAWHSSFYSCMHGVHAHGACMPCMHLPTCVRHACICRCEHASVYIYACEHVSAYACVYIHACELHVSAYACIRMHGMHIPLAGPAHQGVYRPVYLGGGHGPWTRAHIYLSPFWCCWSAFGFMARLWNRFGSFWGPFGAPWCQFGSLWATLGPSGCPFGCF